MTWCEVYMRIHTWSPPQNATPIVKKTNQQDKTCFSSQNGDRTRLARQTRAAFPLRGRERNARIHSPCTTPPPPPLTPSLSLTQATTTTSRKIQHLAISDQNGAGMSVPSSVRRHPPCSATRSRRESEEGPSSTRRRRCGGRSRTPSPRFSGTTVAGSPSVAVGSAFLETWARERAAAAAAVPVTR